MKNKKFILGFLVLVAACIACKKDFLEKRPLGQLDEASITNKKGVENLLIGAYSLLDGIGGNKSGFFSGGSNWLFGNICGSEAYVGSDNNDGARHVILPFEKFSLTGYNEALASKWATLYDGVQRTNEVLRLLPKVKDLSISDFAGIAAEAKFLRAHYHFEAKKIWNKIPLVTDTITFENGNYHLSNSENAWLGIESDLEFAIKNLLSTPRLGSIGRANKYSAMALLAKAYLFQQKFAMAKPLLDSIILSGRYELVNYSDNFNPATQNNKESIFSVQMSVNDGADGLNGNWGDVLTFPMGSIGTAPGGCCGFGSPTQYLVNHFKTDTNGLPNLDDYNTTDVTSDEGLDSNQPFIPYKGFLDPRLDWTVGRRGIPYLDWGTHPGANWARPKGEGGPYSPKKNVYYKSQETHLTDASYWTRGITTNNINLIRFADVLLWAAEVEIELGNLEAARNYVNQIRDRAKIPSGWVRKADGNPAAAYKIELYSETWTSVESARKSVRYERMLELGMEGHRFFDLVRWGIADVEINAYLSKEKRIRTYLMDVRFRKNCNEYFPIPQAQIDLSRANGTARGMTQNPCN